MVNHYGGYSGPNIENRGNWPFEVQCVARDPLCEDYMLISFYDGSTFLVSTQDGNLLFALEKQNHPLQKIIWLPSQPGNFFSYSSKLPTLTLWNVSQPKPLEKIKAGLSQLMGITSFRENINSNNNNNQERLLLSFKNGSIAVADVLSDTGTGGVAALKKTFLKNTFQTSGAHSETIFDLAFNPINCNVFGTASYDGMVKLWNCAKKETFREFPAEGILYACGWSKDGSMIAATTSNGMLYVWKADTGRQLACIKTHEGNSSSYRLSWHPIDRNLIVTGGCDNYAVITNIKEKQIKRQYRHPLVVFGVQWSPKLPNFLCTACQDGQIRIFDTEGSSNNPITVLGGHTARVFNISFHPFFVNLLASGSDDKTVRIWDFHKKCEVMQLSGHTSFVRALCWHSEILQILLSGSWDATIRVWDVSKGVCLCVSRQHHADVYGLDAHPYRPFMFVSSSRDTTLRFWTLEELAGPFLLKAVLETEIVQSNARDQATNYHQVCLQGLQQMIGDASKGESGLVNGNVAGPEFFNSSIISGNNPTQAELNSPTLKHITLGGTSVINSPTQTSSGKYLLFGQAFRDLVDELNRKFVSAGQSSSAAGGNQSLDNVALKLALYRSIFHFFSYRSNLDDIWGLFFKIAEITITGNGSTPNGTTSSHPHHVHHAQHGANPISKLSSQSVSIHMTTKCSIGENSGTTGIVGAGTGSTVNIDSATQIWHESEVLHQEKAQALQLTSSSSGGGIIAGSSVGAVKKEERLQVAANMLLRCGDIRGYCELLAQADKWEQSIMMAPMVSLEFWKKMHREYLQKKAYCLDLNSRVATMIASEKTDLLVEGMIAQNSYLEAFVCAKAECEGNYFKVSHATPTSGTVPGSSPSTMPTLLQGGQFQSGGSAPSRRKMYEVTLRLVQRYMSESEPVAGACAFFAISDIKNGLATLFRGNEMLLYWVCERCLGNGEDNYYGGPMNETVLLLLAKQCERYKLRDLAKKLYSMSSNPANIHRMEMLTVGVRCPVLGLNFGISTDPMIRQQFENLRQQSGIPPGDVGQNNTGVVGTSSLANIPPGFDVCNLIKSSFHCGEIEFGVDVFLNAVFFHFRQQSEQVNKMDFESLYSLFACIECCNLTQLSVEKVVNVLACCAYWGFVQAFLRGYTDILLSLVHTLQNIIVHRNLDFPCNVSDLFILEAVMVTKANPRDRIAFERLCNLQKGTGRSDHRSDHMQRLLDAHVNVVRGLQESLLAGDDGMGSLSPITARSRRLSLNNAVWDGSLSEEAPKNLGNGDQGNNHGSSSYLQRSPLGEIVSRIKIPKPEGIHWLFDRMDDNVWHSLGAFPSLVLTGSLLPSEKEAQSSVLTNQLIRGVTFTLEDGKHSISLLEASLWSRVNHLSPLNTGYPMEPY